MLIVVSNSNNNKLEKKLQHTYGDYEFSIVNQYYRHKGRTSYSGNSHS